MNLDPDFFEQTIKGKKTFLHLLQNANLKMSITNYGARIVSLIIADKSGKSIDVIIGFDTLNNYLNSSETYHGTIVGRYANRIAKGKFSLHGQEFQLAINNKSNHLHGGPNGFHNQVWNIDELSNDSVKLSYDSPHGEENYPGNLHVQLQYHLSANNELIIDYRAETDQSTIINLTSHPFFNLNGIGSGTITNHLLQVNANAYNPVDHSLIPTGIAPVENTPFDFRQPETIGSRINTKHEQLKHGGGYDHNFVLNGEGFRSVATATGDQSGISMEVLTDQPGMQLYSGNFMKGNNRIKYNFSDDFRSAFCLETQHFPDSPNQPDFPTTTLEPGEVFASRTIYKFYIP